MCCTANAVANFFIEKSMKDKTPLSHMKIQKMIFFAHAVFFKKYHKPLIVDPVFAWKYGPVIQSLYHELKDYGDSPITRKISELTLSDAEKDVIFKTPEINHQNTLLLDFLTNAYNSLNKMSASRLCSISHAKDGAWYKTLKSKGIDPESKNPDIPRNLVILDDAIEECGR